MTIIPFLSAMEINQIEDYIRFRNLKLYIQSKSKLVSNSKELMSQAGYGNYQKFKDHRIQFDTCKRDIPLHYLKAIDIDLEIVKFCQELDMEEFQYTKDLKNLFPEYAIIRYMPAIYGNKEFPPNTGEDAAIEILRQFNKETKLRCAINYPDFKTIYFSEAGEKVTETYYPPLLKITKSKLVFQKGGQGIGQTRLR